MTLRRLPVYMLLDCSESMVGDAIETVGRGVDLLLKQLKFNPDTVDNVFLSSIVFAGAARQMTPLTDLALFPRPELRVRPGTAMGSALRELLAAIDREVVRNSTERKGDFKPIVFLLTDGEPTDDWVDAAAAVAQERGRRIAEVYAIGCGPDANLGVLQAVTPNVYSLKDMSREPMEKLFIWVSNSVGNATRSVLANVPMEVPPLPVDMERIDDKAPVPGRPTSLFVHAWCTQEKKEYLMRFRRVEDTELFDPVDSHPLPQGDATEKGSYVLPSVRSSSLRGVPPCPYCSNPDYGKCPCEAVLCLAPYQRTAFCPACTNPLQFTEGDFEVPPTEG